MGKHSMEEPPSAEEPAARGRARLSRPAIVAAAAAAVVVLGATAWAIARPDGPPNVAGSDVVDGLAPSAGEGFGQAAPTSAAPSSGPRVSRSPGTPAPPPSASPGTSAPATTGASSPPPAAATGSVSAKYTMSSWPGAYKLEFVLANKTADPALWTVRLVVPAGARLDQWWNSEVTQESATVWLFRPPRWDGGNPARIPPGGEFPFGLIVQGAETVVSCTVSGSACTH